MRVRAQRIIIAHCAVTDLIFHLSLLLDVLMLDFLVLTGATIIVDRGVGVQSVFTQMRLWSPSYRARS